MTRPSELIREALPLDGLTPEAANLRVEWCYQKYIEDPRPSRTPIERRYKIQAVIGMCLAMIEAGNGPQYPPLRLVKG